MVFFHLIKNSIILFFDHIKITKTIYNYRKERFLKSTFVVYLKKSYIFFKDVFFFVLSDFKAIFNFLKKYILRSSIGEW